MTITIDQNNALGNEALLKVIEHIERLVEQRDHVSETIKEAYSFAEGEGLDKRTIREMIRLRALDKEDREARENFRDLYMCALGLDR